MLLARQLDFTICSANSVDARRGKYLKVFLKVVLLSLCASVHVNLAKLNEVLHTLPF